MRLRVALVIVSLAWAAPPAPGHYHILRLEHPSVKKGEEVTIGLLFGHPFEHQLFDVTPPKGLVVLTPDGKTVDLKAKLRKGTADGDKGKKVTVYGLKYTPEERGDYVFVLTSGLVYLEDDKEYVQDTVKAVLHVQAQKNWDATSRDDFEWAPLTRPYGLLPGCVFQAQINHLPRPGKGERVNRAVRDAIVEVERYNRKPPEALPPDEFVTRTVKTDPSGVVTTTLPEPGWWALTIERPGRTSFRLRDKQVQVKQRCTLWVHVDRPPGAK
jgi:cobalt/nickel transport protein